MAIREDLVASAAKFLQDPSVSSSPPESRVAFLKAKNLTPEEISAALSRAGLEGSGGPLPSPAVRGPPGPSGQAPPPQPYFGNSPYGQYPPYGWQPPPPEIPRRDWRDWFIMATVVGGVGYGLYSMTKRYVYPLVSPPTPDRLEQDKKAIDEQFDRAFALVEQLAKDTETLKTAEKERTERLDTALNSLEATLADLRAANKRREDDAERLRDDVKGLKEAMPKAMEAQKEVTDGRLREVNAELRGLKTLVSQRLAPASSVSANGTNIARIGSSDNLRATNNTTTTTTTSSPSTTPAPTSSAVAPAPTTITNTTTAAGTSTETETKPTSGSSTPNNGFVSGYSATNLANTGVSNNNPSSVTYGAGAGVAASSSSGISSVGKASIPAWQRAMLKPSASSTTSSTAAGSSSNANNTATAGETSTSGSA